MASESQPVDNGLKGGLWCPRCQTIHDVTHTRSGPYGRAAEVQHGV